MSRWFRHYAGMMRDEKLVRVALKSQQSMERVVWVWGAILESAAEINDGGRYDFDTAEAAYFLRADEADIRAIETSLADGGRVCEGRVAKWGNRQFKSDDSAERVRRHRVKSGGGDNGGDIAGQEIPERYCNDDVTTCNAPETETETETEKKESSRAPRADNQKFEEFWKEYPKRKGDNPKNPARKLFEAAIRQGVDPDSVVRGLKRAKEKNHDKIGTEFIPQAVKWLRDRRWEDYQDAPDPPSGPLTPDEGAFEWLKKTGKWHRDYGPEPGMPGCRAPAELLERYGYKKDAA